MFGKNAITKKQPEYNGTINVVSVFYTIQGEGPFSGEPCVFIRFQGCPLRCSFCDTEFESGDSWEVNKLVQHVSTMLKPVRGNGPLVVITGGEPMIQPGIVELTRKLIYEEGASVQVETAGVVWQEGFDKHLTDHFFSENFFIICSPKTGKLNPELEKHIHAYKYVLKHDGISEEDGLPVISPETNKSLILARPTTPAPVYVMPCDEYDEERNKKNVQACVKASMEHGYKLCLQVHKLVGVE